MEELSRGLLDTSVLIAREEDSQIESSLPQEIAISVATLAELHFGVLVAKDDETRQLRLQRLGTIEATLQPIPTDVPHRAGLRGGRRQSGGAGGKGRC